MTPYEIQIATLRVSIIGMVALVGTLVAYLLILRETRKASKSQNLLTLMNFLQSKEVRDARTHVIKYLDCRCYKCWTEADKDFGATVASSYGSAGVILHSRIVDIKPFINSWGYSINKTHKILKPFIDEKRKEAGLGYWCYYDWLNNEVIKNPQSKTFDAANKAENDNVNDSP